MSKKKKKVPGLVTSPALLTQLMEKRKVEKANKVPVITTNSTNHVYGSLELHEQKVIREKERAVLRKEYHALIEELHKKYDKILNSMREASANGVAVETNLKNHKQEIEELINLDNKNRQMKTTLGSSVGYGYYRNLCIDLISTDRQFSLYFDIKDLATTPCLNLKKIKDDKLRKEILNRLGGKDMPNFNLYAKYFPELIEYIDNISETKYGLAVDASSYLNINDKAKAMLNNNIFYYFDLLNNNPEIIKYFTNEELNKLVLNEPQRIGTFLAKYPEVLLKLPVTTFSIVNLSIVFQSVVKEKLYLQVVKMGLLEELYNRFPEFRDYFTADVYQKNSTTYY